MADTNISGNFFPDVDAEQEFGTAANRWKNIYLSDNIVIENPNFQENLNADLLDGRHASDFLPASTVIPSASTVSVSVARTFMLMGG